MNAAVFLDRDNTIIHNDGDLGDPAGVRLIQGAASAIASLCGLGYKVVVITNQGGVARGKYTEQDVQAVHHRLAELVTRAANGAQIERFYYCPYHPQGSVTQYACEHPTRKPQPGMLLEAAKDLSLDLSQSWMIGDQLRDIEAGSAAGTRTILLQQGAARTPPLEVDEQRMARDRQGRVHVPGEPVSPDFIARNLVEAVRIVAQQRKPEASEELSRNSRTGKRWDAAAVARLQVQRPPFSREAQRSASGERRQGDREKDPRLAGAAQPPVRTGEAPPEAQSAAAPAEPASAGGAAVESPFSREAQRSASEARQGDRETRRQGDEEPRLAGAAQPPLDPSPDPQNPQDSEPSGSETQDFQELDPVERTLRLILQELRHQRGTTGEDFSFRNMLAIVFQMLAGVCLLGALWMGAGNDPLFLRWIGAGLLLQGATIATLLFGRL